MKPSGRRYPTARRRRDPVGTVRPRRAAAPVALIVRSLIAALLLVSLPLASATGAAPPVVTGAAEPPEGCVKLELVEEWRAGGEDDEIFFGSVGRIDSDERGLVYILDSQLSQVQVYSPDGEFLRSLAREGDGPGEVRRPNDMLLRPDGEVWLLQGFPGKIVKVTADGQPAGSAQYDAGGGQGQFAVLNGGRSLGEADILLVGIRMSFGGALSRQTYFVDICQPDGQSETALLEKEHTIDYSSFHLDELAMDFVWTRFATGPDGRIYFAPTRNEYRIDVFAPDGTPERIIERPFTSLPRDESQRERAHQIIEAIGAYYPTPPQKITIEDHEPDVSGLYIRPDGELWVLSSRGAHERPPGVFAVLDVFDAEGVYRRQVELVAPGDAENDSLFFLRDGRPVVVVGALDAFLTQQGVTGGGSEEAPEAVPLEVICYRIQ
jgi:hypothetical protein